MNKALFLDRDGVLNRERGEYTYLAKDFELLPDVSSALKLVQEKGFLLIVVSNQGGIAKGLYTHSQVEGLHSLMASKLSESGIYLDEFYYCPHHDAIGKCICRKPNSLMLEKAIARFDIDVNESVFIGDSNRDVEAAEKVGVKGILVDSNSSFLKIVTSL